MSRRAIRLQLSNPDQSELKKLLAGGVQQVRVTLRALALLRLQQGFTAPQVARMVQLTDQAVRQIARRYREGVWSERCMKGRGQGKAGYWTKRSGKRSWRWCAEVRPRGKPAGPYG